MIKLGEAQFALLLLSLLVTLYLVLLNVNRTRLNEVFSRARWLMAVGTALLTAQFAIQYGGGFRASSLTMGVLVNLLLFTPACYFINIAILYLQRQGRITRREWLIGPAGYGLILVLLLGGAFFDRHDETEEDLLRGAELVSAALLSITLFYYYGLQYIEYRRTRRVLANYYDYDTENLQVWLERHSLGMMVLLGILLPVCIFLPPKLVTLYGLGIFVFVFFNIMNFVCYGVSRDANQVVEAEESDDETKMEEQEEATPLPDEERQRVETAVSQWLKDGGHLKKGITMQTVVSEMHLPRHLMTAWLRTTEQELFHPWLTHLRIEHAKRLIKEHPEWSNDYIAQQCGFSSRNYFQTVFKKQMDMTPSQYLRMVAPDFLK